MIQLRNPFDKERRKGRATVPINDSLLAALTEAKEGGLSPYVIEWAGAPVKSIKKGIKTAGTSIGRPDASPHMLRHSAAVRLAEDGHSMEEISQFLGPSNTATTYRVYARYGPTYLRRACCFAGGLGSMNLWSTSQIGHNALEYMVGDDGLEPPTSCARARTRRTSSFHPYVPIIAELLCLKGCRVSEIVGLKWSEVDLDQNCLWLEDTKSGRSLRAIDSTAIAILKRQPRLMNSPYVFPGAKGAYAYQGMNKEARRLFAAADLADASCHTLRHTFASVASGIGYSDGTIAGLLGHKGKGVTSRYVHRPDQALLSAAEATSSAITA